MDITAKFQVILPLFITVKTFPSDPSFAFYFFAKYSATGDEDIEVWLGSGADPVFLFLRD